MDDIKELNEFMERDDGKSAVSEWLKESGYRSADDVSGLEHKKDELLGKVAKSQKDKAALNALYTKHGIIDFDDLDVKLAQLKGAEEKGTELEKMQRRLEIIEKTAKDADARASREKVLRADSEKRAQIISALKGAHVNDDSIDILMPYFSGQVKIDEDDEGGINLTIETTDGPSPLKAYVDAWSKTDKAKIYINAPGNSGAGAAGAGASGGAAEADLAKIEKLPQSKRIEAYKRLGIIKE